MRGLILLSKVYDMSGYPYATDFIASYQFFHHKVGVFVQFHFLAHNLTFDQIITDKFDIYRN